MRLVDLSQPYHSRLGLCGMGHYQVHVMIVIATGGRDWWFHAGSKECDFLASLNPSLLIEGGCSGADRSSGDWAELNSIPHLRCPVKPDQEWPSKGPIRNTGMAEFAHANVHSQGWQYTKSMYWKGPMTEMVVAAFPGGKGTASMKRIARKYGIPIKEFGEWLDEDA